MGLHDYTVMQWASIWLHSMLGLLLAQLVIGCLLGALAFVLGAMLVIAGGAA